MLEEMKTALADLMMPATLLPHDGGWPLFGRVHLLWLRYASAVVVLCTLLYRHLSSKKARKRMTWIVVIIPLVLLASQDIGFVVTGTFTPSWWPLHSCNACEYLGLLYAIWPAAWIGETLFCLSATGAVCALLFPGWAWCPPLSWPVICGFTEHSLMLALVLMKLSTGELVPSLKRLWQAVAFSGAYLVFCLAINERFGTNFMFVSTPAEGSPLEFFASWLGWPGYLVPYAAGILGIWVLMHKAVSCTGRGHEARASGRHFRKAA